eukprot:1052857-Alexandrium_andersonii.AAC.1
MEAARNLFQDPTKQAAALARVILPLARKTNAGEKHTQRLADVVNDIRSSQGPAQASASAPGGGD